MSASRAGTTAVLEQMEKHLQHQQMVQVNSRYWPMVHGNAPDEAMRVVFNVFSGADEEIYRSRLWG